MIWELGGRPCVRPAVRGGRGGGLPTPVVVGTLGFLVLGACAGCSGGGGGSAHPSPSASVVGKSTLFPSDSGDTGGQGGGGIGFPAVKVGESADTVVEMKNDRQRAWDHDKPKVAGNDGDSAQGSQPAGADTEAEPEATGGGQNVYRIIEDHCGDDPIQPGKSCTFKIRFTRGSDGAPPAVMLEIDSPTWPIRKVVTAASKPGVTPNTFPSGLEPSGPANSPGNTVPTGPDQSPVAPSEPVEDSGPVTEPGNPTPVEPGGGDTPPAEPATPAAPAT